MWVDAFERKEPWDELKNAQESLHNTLVEHLDLVPVHCVTAGVELADNPPPPPHCFKTPNKTHLQLSGDTQLHLAQCAPLASFNLCVLLQNTENKTKVSVE